MIKYKYLLVHLNQILNNNQTLNSYTNQHKGMNPTTAKNNDRLCCMYEIKCAC